MRKVFIPRFTHDGENFIVPSLTPPAHDKTLAEMLGETVAWEFGFERNGMIEREVDENNKPVNGKLDAFPVQVGPLKVLIVEGGPLFDEALETAKAQEEAEAV